MYNINNDTEVKMESYLDDKNNNNWRKVTDLVDNGGWYAKRSDKNFIALIEVGQRLHYNK